MKRRRLPTGFGISLAVGLAAIVVAGCGGPSATGSTGIPVSPGPTQTESFAIASGSPAPSIASSPTTTAKHGVFTIAAPYVATHAQPMLAPLADGRVLILDGPAGYPVTPRTAELYNPDTNSFSVTGSLVPGGSGEVMTPLHDGRVLVTGASPDSAAEIYDPATRKFALTGPMVDPNRSAEVWEFSGVYTATVLKDGRVLIAGGAHRHEDVEDTILRTAEVYDPATGKFTVTGSMLHARENQTATLLPNGRVLIAGGDEGQPGGKHLRSAETYDPVTGKFSATGSMSSPRAYATATLLAGGRVLIAGGENVYGQSLASAEIYDPATGKFSSTGSMSAGRSQPTTCLLLDGSVLILAGYNPSNLLNSAERYNPVLGKFTATGSLLHQIPYADTFATRLKDGRVLVVGDSPSAAEWYWP